MFKKSILSAFLTLFPAVPLLFAVPMGEVPAEAENQVTYYNWREPEFNHWSFRNLGIHPSALVARDGRISQLEYSPDPSIESLTFTWNGRDYTFDEALREDRTDGIIVLKDGKVVFERYYGDFGPRDYHMWASSTKSLVGMVAGILSEEGLLDPRERVDTYIPELEGTALGTLRVREALNMVSAVDYSEDYVNMAPGMIHYEYFRRLGFVPAFDIMKSDPLEGDVKRSVLELLPEFKRNEALRVGEKFEYHSPNVDVVGWIIQRVTGMPLNKAIENYLWGELETEHDANLMLDQGFNGIATGGFVSTLRDAARFGLAVLNEGRVGDKQVIPARWIEETIALSDQEVEQGQRSDYREPGSPVYDDKLQGYKNFWWVHDRDKGIMMTRGVYGQGIYVNRSANVVIATFGSADSASNAARPEWRAKLHGMEVVAEYLAD